MADNMHDVRFEIYRLHVQVPERDTHRNFGRDSMQIIGASRVAQWIERSFPKRQVVGSNPISGDMNWQAVLSEMMMLASTIVGGSPITLSLQYTQSRFMIVSRI